MNRAQSKNIKKQTGFTMIEVIAVLIIMGIISAVAISRIGSVQSDLPVQADIVKSHLRFANLKALQDDTATWGISFGSSSYALLCNNAPTTIQLPGENSGTHTFPTGVTISSTSANVNFDSWGSPGTANVSITLSQSGVTTAIVIAGNTGFITP